jgi:four helix bundle protein
MMQNQVNPKNMFSKPNAKPPPSQSFEDLIVWQKAHQFVLSIYRLTEAFPSKEIYGLTSQFRRGGISIPANIAEGWRKSGRLDKLRFFNIAHSSLEECRYYLILTRDLRCGDIEPLLPLVEETSKLLGAYSGTIHRRLAMNAYAGLLLGACFLLAPAFWFLS